MRDTNNVAVNRNYKDTVFRMLFSDKQNLLSLYNAVNGRSYEDPEELEIVTLENAIYMGMKNDLAFIVDTNLYLYEHQSTYNPNIPLRDLFYIASEYQKLVDKKSLYISSIIKIPAPQFIVFYNGTRKVTDKQELRLSQMYENFKGEPALELIVTMFNVNEGHNKELMEQCQILNEYAIYVAKVRKYAQNMKLEKAVNRAVDECIKEGILAEFLKANKAEVIAVSIFEYDKEEEEKKLRRAEYEAGREAGEREGRIAGEKVGRDIGEREGRIAGEKIGLENGIKLGKSEGIQSMIFSFLTDYGTIPKELKSYILKEQNEEKLCQWSKLAARVNSIEEFQEKIS